MRQKISSGLLTALTLLMTLSSQGAELPVKAEIEFGGTLVAEPCVVAPGGDGNNVVVDFGTIPDKIFYSTYGHRTWLQPFHILLTGCDMTLGQEVKITFSGAEDSEQPGLLAINSSSGVKHLAIGLQTNLDTDLLFNKQTPAYALRENNTQLNFKAYIQASEEGVRNKSVGLGYFDAVATFELEYP